MEIPYIVIIHEDANKKYMYTKQKIDSVAQFMNTHKKILK